MLCRPLWLLAIAAAFCVPAPGQPNHPIEDSSYGWRLPSPVGVGVWWCEATYKVGRQRAIPSETREAVQISAARNEYEPFQIVLRPETTWSNLTVSVSDFVLQGGAATIGASNTEACVVGYVPVTMLSDFSGTKGPHPDPLLPITGPFTVAAESNQPVWFTVYVPKESPAGFYDATVTFQGPVNFSVPVRLRVFNFSLPETTHTRTAYYAFVDWAWHRPASPAQQREIWELYLQNFRRHRVSPYSAHLYSPIVWTLANGDFQVDFRDFDAVMERHVDEFGFNSFNLFGYKSPSFPSPLGGYEAFTPAWQQWFAKLMQPIQAHLRERGWHDQAYCYWMDEPQDEGFSRLLEGMDALEAGAPGLRRLLTFDHFPASTNDARLNGRVEIWTPMLPLSLADRFVSRSPAGEERWWYICVGPWSPFPNNFIDHPAINHRVRFWMAEKYGITGDLYWAVNYWGGRDPWTNAWTYANGDGVLIYPPVQTPPAEPLVAGPINSLRWELIRESLEDAEYFWLLRQQVTNGMLRLGPDHAAVLEGLAAREAALGCVTNLVQYTKDPQELYALRRRIAEAIENLDSGAPMIVSPPRARAVPTGARATLRVDALGWPPPAYQWRQDGVELSGATTSSLTLSNFAPPLAGDYQVVVSNAAGVVTSAVARVAGYWTNLPAILADPVSLVRPAGERAVFEVTAVSASPMSYRWTFNGAPMDRPSATNAALVLTKLTLPQAGDYSVIVSNAVGPVTSRVARLTVLVTNTTYALVTTGAAWRYHDLGQDLGMVWRETWYDDSAWPAGPAQLGFGDGDEATVIGLGQGDSDAAPTFYFRHAFPFAQATLRFPLTGRVLCDDGAVVYLNGTEVFRTNLPGGPVIYGTPAIAVVDGAAESRFHTFSVPPETLRPGTNVVAIEVHQSAGEFAQLGRVDAAWAFEELGSPWNDSVGTNNFSAVGTNVLAWAGRVGGSVSNAGAASDYLVAADSPELRYSGPFTVGGWFAFGLGTAAPAAGLEKAGEFSLHYTGTALNRYRFQVGGVYVQDATCCTTAGQWRFVVGWFDGTNVNIQVDNGTVYSAPANPPTATTNPLVALKLLSSAGGLAADELFLCKRVLSAAERAIRFQARTETNHHRDLSFDFALTATGGQLPQLLSNPASQVRRTGDSVAFTVEAASATPLGYQWNFNRVPLAGATNGVLFLSQLTADRAGHYSVTVTNAAGGATTPPATLSVIGTPEIRALVTAGGSGCLLQIPGYGVPATVLVSTNLVDWSELLRLPASLASTNISDSSGTNALSRFYRLRLDL